MPKGMGTLSLDTSLLWTQFNPTKFSTHVACLFGTTVFVFFQHAKQCKAKPLCTKLVHLLNAMPWPKQTLLNLSQSKNLLYSSLPVFSSLHLTQRHPTTSWRCGTGLLRTRCLWRRLAAHCCLKGSTPLLMLSPFSLRLTFISPSLALPLTSPVSIFLWEVDLL